MFRPSVIGAWPLNAAVILAVGVRWGELKLVIPREVRQSTSLYLAMAYVALHAVRHGSCNQWCPIRKVTAKVGRLPKRSDPCPVHRLEGRTVTTVRPSEIAGRAD